MSALWRRFIFSLLLSSSVCQEEEGLSLPKRNNLVCAYINSLFGQISKGMSIPEIDLGEHVGSFSNIEIKQNGEMKKSVDGVGSFGFKLDASIQEIAIGGKYALENLEIPGLFPVFGKGSFSIRLNAVHLRVHMTAEADFGSDKFDLNIRDFDFSLKNSTFRFDDFMDDPFVTDFLNELIGNLIPDLVRTILDAGLVDLMTPLIDYYGNGIINCIKTELISGKVNECILRLFRDIEERLQLIPFNFPQLK